MQAIHVKTLSATETKCRRYKAVGLDMCVVTPIDYKLSSEANAAYAAQELVDRYNSRAKWKVRILGIGTLPDNTWAVLLTCK
ncbi:hypothetical protein FHJ51_02850 [Shigella sonnei]|nr:hypothetical protein [Shigella sonnei]